jgi:predicted transglutaminase-like cysteine proteinase
MLRRFTRLSLHIIIMVTAVNSGALAPAYAEDFRIFGTKEEFSSNVQPFPKWTGVLSKDGRHREMMQKLCGMSRGDSCPWKQWQGVIDAGRSLSAKQKLDLVNRRMNQNTYITDIVNWSVDDYWETPYEFYTRDGDCEDYAIIKYMTLKELGFSDDEMRVVILQDRNLNLMHSILVVREDGTNYILDNQISQVVRDSDIHHYSPIYSINGQGWWRHLQR